MSHSNEATAYYFALWKPKLSPNYKNCVTSNDINLLKYDMPLFFYSKFKDQVTSKIFHFWKRRLKEMSERITLLGSRKGMCRLTRAQCWHTALRMPAYSLRNEKHLEQATPSALFFCVLTSLVRLQILCSHLPPSSRKKHHENVIFRH